MKESAHGFGQDMRSFCCLSLRNKYLFSYLRYLSVCTFCSIFDVKKFFKNFLSLVSRIFTGIFESSDPGVGTQVFIGARAQSIQGQVITEVRARFEEPCFYSRTYQPSMQLFIFRSYILPRSMTLKLPPSFFSEITSYLN